MKAPTFSIRKLVISVLITSDIPISHHISVSLFYFFFFNSLFKSVNSFGPHHTCSFLL